MRTRSPAKINLWLKILGRRPDGFHQLNTLMIPLSLADSMTFERAEKGIRLNCSDLTLPTDERNLVVRAALALQKKFGVRAGARIMLRKSVPVGGGLGGGSSNAATTLVALNQFWKLGANDAELLEIASALGSDVAFFLQSKPALCEGRGEIVTSVECVGALSKCWFVLVNPSFGVSTKWAYQHSGAKKVPSPKSKVQSPKSEVLGVALPEDVGKLARLLENSLEKPVFTKFPLLALLKRSLLRHGALGAAMSGSGATVFGIVRSRADGDRVARALRAEFGPTLWTCVARPIE